MGVDMRDTTVYKLTAPQAYELVGTPQAYELYKANAGCWNINEEFRSEEQSEGACAAHVRATAGCGVWFYYRNGGLCECVPKAEKECGLVDMRDTTVYKLKALWTPRPPTPVPTPAYELYMKYTGCWNINEEFMSEEQSEGDCAAHVRATAGCGVWFYYRNDGLCECVPKEEGECGLVGMRDTTVYKLVAPAPKPARLVR